MADIEQDASFGISNFRLIIKLLIEHGCLLLIGTETNSFPLQTEHQEDVRFCALAPLLAPARQNRIASVETMTTQLEHDRDSTKSIKEIAKKKKKEYVTVFVQEAWTTESLEREKDRKRETVRERERETRENG